MNTNYFLPTTYGFDWDGTITRDQDTWLTIARLLRKLGHTVFIVTMRYPSEIKHPDSPISDEWLEAVNGIYCTDRQAKRVHMEKLGIPVHVWMEDNPEAVHMSALQIWGWCTPEGTITVPEKPETHPGQSLLVRQELYDIEAMLKKKD